MIGSLLLAASAFATTTDYDVQTYGGWGSCAACAGINANGSVVGYWMKQWESSPSLDGKTTEFHIESGPAYSDVLWWKQLTTNYTTVNDAHHFVYDTYFYLKNPSAAQNLEFDVNQFINGKSFIFGTQCNIRGGHVWDVWNNVKKSWVSTGIYCATPSAYTWHHVVIAVERTWDNKLHYISIALDGNTHYINWYYDPISTSWQGITVNFQMDGDYAGTAYSTWIDKLKLTWW
jgi:hypothetical protein